MRVVLSSIVTIPLLAACVAPTPGAVRQVPDPVSTRYINPGTLAAFPATWALRRPKRSRTSRRSYGSAGRPRPTSPSSRFMS